MLSPRYLDGLSDEIADIYAQLEADILKDMARRIAKLGKITEASKWQAAMLAETGALKKDVARIIKKYDPKKLKFGYNIMPDGEEIYFIPNPALGLWMSKDKLEK